MAFLDNIVAYWKLDEGPGQRNDSVGTSHLTDNNTVSSAAGKIGNAAHFILGNIEYLSLADNAAVSMGDFDFFMECWVWLDTKPAIPMTIISKDDNLAGQQDYLLQWASGPDRFQFFVYNSAGVIKSVTAASFGSPSTATWYHIVAWHDATADTLNICVNNGAVDSAPTAGIVPNDSAAGFRAGAQWLSGAPFRFWDGRIDEVGIFKRLPTADDRAFFYNGGAGRSYDFGVSGSLAVTEAIDAAAMEGNFVTGHIFEAELNGLGGGWTDISEDTLLQSPGVALRYGIAGTGPLDLVASTGTLKFSLNNSEDNSAGKLGYYSPRHADVRPGFVLGIRVRYSYLVDAQVYGKFVGRLREIDPEPGRYRDRKTHCLAVDWMNEAAITKYSAPTQVNKRTDEILSTIVALVPRQPDSTSFDVADSTFLYALDNGPTEGASVMTEMQRLCQSEFGRGYVRGGLGYFGRLRFEKRTARLTPQPVAAFDGTMQDLDAGGSSAKIKNKATVTAHPRRVDAVNTIVLFAKANQSNPAVTPASTIKMSGKLVDPSNPNARIGGTDMIAPAATTDYLMNAAADGSGSDLTANFTVTPAYDANQVDYSITNNGGTTGYVTKLQARGRGLYDYDPLDAEAKNTASIALIGESPVALDMLYQSDFSVAQAVAQFLVDTWSDEGATAPGVTEASIKFIPRTEAELTAAMALEVGDAISVMESVVAMNGVYFIQSVGIKITGDKVVFDFDLQRALVQNYWQLGTAGYSELGVTTVLAPL